MHRAVASALLVLAAVTPAAGQWRQGLTARGLDSLRQAVRVDSVDAEAYYRLGLGLWEQRRYDAADSAFQRAVHFAPWHAGAHLALGNLPYGRGGRFLFDIRTRLRPDSLRTYFTTALMHTRAAFLSDPLLDLSPFRFIEDDQLVPQGGGWLCFSGICVLMSRDTRWPRPTRRAVRQLVLGRADSAYTTLREALAHRHPDEVLPDDFIWYFALAADRSGHPDEAADGFRELAQRASRRDAGAFIIGPAVRERSLLLVMYGMASERAGRTAVARAAFQEALVADLTIPEAHARLADIAEGNGDLEEALQERRAAIDLTPESGRLHLDLGITLLQAGRTAEARDALAEAAIRLPWDPGTQMFLFQAAMAMHDLPTAERALASLELFAPQRNREQVESARRAFDQVRGS